MDLHTPCEGLGRLRIIEQKLKDLNSRAEKYCVVIFAGDNGISREGTSIYPPMQSAEIVKTHLNGTSPTVKLIRRIGSYEYIIDVGLYNTVAHSKVLSYNIRRGTADFLVEDALNRGQTIRAIDTGRLLWEEINCTDFDIIGVGEIGSGNTLCAAALAAVFTGISPVYLAGRGSSNSKVIAQKADIICKALDYRYPDVNSIVDSLSRFGGLEIAALTGFISQAAEKNRIIMLDGYVTAVAALAASIIDSRVLRYIIAPSLSDESGHQIILNKLGLPAIFDLGFNYGEGLAATWGLFLTEMTAAFFKGISDPKY